jgi:hypothetical protein
MMETGWVNEMLDGKKVEVDGHFKSKVEHQVQWLMRNKNTLGEGCVRQVLYRANHTLGPLLLSNRFSACRHTSTRASQWSSAYGPSPSGTPGTEHKGAVETK